MFFYNYDFLEKTKRRFGRLFHRGPDSKYEFIAVQMKKLGVCFSKTFIYGH